MWLYDPPLRDMRFVIERVLDAPAHWASMPALADCDVEVARQVLEEAGRFCAGVLAPINASGDLEGCRWIDGEISTPAGFREAYAAFVDGGWASLSCHPDDGGQGLPSVLDAAFNEMMAAANHAWTMYPGLLHGAYECLRAHGSAELKERYLARIASGQWLATMNLTEPQAGSDLGRLRTLARPAGDDSYRITGNKIFISGGEHDLTDNIVHLVLARLPDAPAGTRGISLFIAPKWLPDGSRNAIHCDGIEKKMGIKGSATCAMRFDDATGWLVGEPHRGLAAMFVMMNSARLHVALQGLGHLEAAQQNAQRYATERIQGRTPTIGHHPAIRRIVLTQRALTEGQRVIAYWTAQLIDQAHHDPQPEARARADAWVGLLTPVAKAFFTDNGHRGADEALQVWGGYGFVHDYGIEQTVRDSRIAMIYEGTNEIQAIDLVMRKLLNDGGRQFTELLGHLALEADRADATDGLDGFGAALRPRLELARTSIQTLVEGAQDAPEWPLQVADDCLRAIGLTLLGWAWTISARLAASDADEPWHARKIATARFGMQWLLPEADWRWARVREREAALPLLD